MKNRFDRHSRHHCVLSSLSYLRLATVLLMFGAFACMPEKDQLQDANATLPAQPWTAEAQPRYARGFDISYEDNFKVLHLYQGFDTTDYLLLPEGMGRPDTLPDATTIKIPVKSLVALSTTHVALADFVEADSLIIGLDNSQYVYDPEVRERVAQGSVTAVGEGGGLNQELVIALQPDLLMVSGMPGTDLQKYQAIVNSGIPVLINTEWMENTPLGKAEWVKLMAALTNREALANQKFDTIAAAYHRIARLTANLEKRPSVISGSPFQGAWYVPGGSSYRAKLYQEAGAFWPWAQDTAAVSIPVAFENMYAYGLEADYWFNPGMVSSLQALLDKDARFGDFKSFNTGQVYNNNRRMTPDGQGNDYFESGVVNPHRILADLTYILHPKLLPEHTLYYYQKLE